MSIDLESLKNLKILAACEADEETFEAFYESICRWYSREFSTPLPQVEDMPVEKVLMTYYQDAFWKASRDKSEEGQNQWLSILTDIANINRPEEELSADEQDDEEYYQEELRKAREQFENSPEKDKNPNLLSIEKDGELVEFNELPPDEDLEDED